MNKFCLSDVVTLFTTPSVAPATNATITTGTSYGSTTQLLAPNDYYVGDVWPKYETPLYTWPSLLYRYEQTKSSFPPMNIVNEKNDKFIEIVIAIAGFSKEDITVETEDEYLIVKGKSSLINDYKDEEVHFIKENLKTTEFERAFTFEDNYFDYKNPKVTLKDGLLKIRINKNPEIVSPKKTIEIE